VSARCHLWCAGLLALIVGAPRAARSASADAVPGEPVISLPPLLVEETDRALRWRYLERPGFQVLSVCDDATTQAFVERQLRLAELLPVVLPARFQFHTVVPEAHLLFNEETGRARSREFVAEMVRKAGATLTAGGIVRADAPMQTIRGGIAIPRIQFLPNMRLMDVDAVRVFAIIDESGVNRMDFMYAPDRVALLLARRTPALPDWFMVGMIGVYQRLWFGDNTIESKPLIWLNEDESSALAHDPDRPRMLLPMREIFGRRPLGTGTPTEERDRVWQAQAALFVRWAIADPTGVRRDALWRWLDRLEAGEGSEDALRACFGCGFADLRDRLSDYLSVAVRDSVVLQGPKSGERPPLNLRAASELEVACIRGDWERLEIAQVRQRYPALTERYIEQARRTLHRAYDRGERDPRLLAVLGLTECDAGNPAAAQSLLEAAVRGGVVRPRVQLELARLRFKDLTARDAGRRLTIAETASVLELLRAAHGVAPPLVDVYALAGRVWLQTESRPSTDDLAMMSDGARLFPAVPGVVMSAINLHVAGGTLSSAADLAHVGAEHARDVSGRERFARLEAELRAMTK
jgi:hypothetical protein